MNGKRSFIFMAFASLLVLVIGVGARVGAGAPPASVSTTLADVPAPTQGPGEHSTLTTFDGSIRDDELADYICSQIPRDNEGNPQVHDVKIMFNSCYGGGMIDDFERVFGPGGACEGVKWVAGAASGPDQPAWGPSDGTVLANPGANLGSRWTNALDDAIVAGGNVQDSFETARDNDEAGPNGYHGEDPVVASGNGGSSIGWNDASDHRAVVFGGYNNGLRHDNNIENVRDALDAVWGDDHSYIGTGWGDADSGTEADLKGLIDTACAGLDSDTQLALYFNDHGDTDFDFDEFLEWLLPYSLPSDEPTTIDFSLHEGWVTGLWAMDVQPLDEPMPTLALSLTEVLTPTDWSITLNGVPIELPPGEPLLGEVILPVDWTSILSGANELVIQSADPTGPPMVLGNLELGSGPISEIEDIPSPVQLPGDHSTLTTYDGHIRDDELADYVCQQILAAGGQVHDVKIMFNSCYGGGMIDDFERVFGPDGPCAGVPWVAGAASGPDQVAWGPSDETVLANPGANLGSRWTNALDDAIRAGGNVQNSFETARDNDRAGPNGYHGEDPVVASGNGGSSIGWTDASSHRAVIFGGHNNALRHDNNIENVRGAMEAVWGGTGTYWEGWGDATSGTEAELKRMIREACSGLDGDTQLALYFNDHGDTDFDFDEYLEWTLPYIVDSEQSIPFSLHEGWVTGLTAMDMQPANVPSPTLVLSLTQPISPAGWTIALNDVLIDLPPDDSLLGEVVLPVDWTSILSGPNVLTIVPPDPVVDPMVLANLELGSGPISELEDAIVYLPLILKE